MSATKISDGIHNGQIKNIVHEKRQGFDYIDVYFDMLDYLEWKSELNKIKEKFDLAEKKRKNGGVL